MSIAERLAAVHARIEAAARASGRAPEGIALVAVSKTCSVDAIREAYAAGQRAFGESYAQELAVKARALADLADLRWHFVGHLQTNKAKIVVEHAGVVHSVDSEALARELGKRAARARTERLPVFIEVNVAHEPQKAGASPSEIEGVMREVEAQPALLLRGLMTVPPAGDLAVARSTFSALATLRNLHGGAAALPDLSMGMTTDLEAAIECGSTCVRVGTAIFGERP